jgi:hypothetical protein
VVKRLESDDLSYASDSLTPTPTPNALNGHDDKFVEFSSTCSNLNTPTALLPPPPNSLSLFTNLNQEQETSNMITANAAATVNPITTNTISAESPEFIPSSLAAVSYPPVPPPLPHLVYSQTGGVDGDYVGYAYSDPSYSYSQTPVSSGLMSPISDLNPTLVDESSLTTPTASSSTIFVHVDAGHIFQVHLGDKCKEIVGPATVKIVSNDSTQPFPLQLTSPAPGQLVQQILNENGILTDLIISSQPQYIHQHPGMHVPNMTGSIPQNHHHHHPHHHQHNYHHLHHNHLQPSENPSSNLIHVSDYHYYYYQSLKTFI